MGLDSVEFVMDVEKEFGISIPDQDAEKLETMALLATYLTGRIGSRVNADDIWARLVRILVERYKVPLGDIVPEARLVKDFGFD